jgi:hypothetical protein
VNAHGTAAPAQKRAGSGGSEALGITLTQLLTNTAKISPTQGRTESENVPLDRWRTSFPIIIEAIAWPALLAIEVFGEPDWRSQVAGYRLQVEGS